MKWLHWQLNHNIIGLAVGAFMVPLAFVCVLCIVEIGRIFFYAAMGW